jgi:hypothetical protein
LENGIRKKEKNELQRAETSPRPGAAVLAQWQKWPGRPMTPTRGDALVLCDVSDVALRLEGGCNGGEVSGEAHQSTQRHELIVA